MTSHRTWSQNRDSGGQTLWPPVRNAEILRTADGWFPVILFAGLLLWQGAEADEFDIPLIADMCAACHGPDGKSPGTMPSIALLDRDAMRIFLLGFRSGEIEGTVMDRIAKGLSEDEIEALAEYFGSKSE